VRPDSHEVFIQHMTRKEFLKLSALLGVGIPFQSTLSACENQIIQPGSNEKIIIIGAGAAGLSAGYLLKQKGIDVEILEASSTFGGRMKHSTDFADFPIPLGAEWIHVEKEILEEIVNDNSVAVNIQTKGYDHDVDYGLFEGQEISVKQIGFDIDLKFINSTWFDFFETYIYPSVSGNISFNTVVDSIDYSGEKVQITSGSQEFTADRVIVTVPVKMLQAGNIDFRPALPDAKQAAISEATVWDGCKAFIEFSEKFYPAFVGFDISPETAGQKLYYDAAYGQNTNKHVLGLFAVGIGSEPYVQLSDEELKNYMLAELDAIFDGKASASYIKHQFQNWNEEPHIGGAYVYDHENWRRVKRLGDSVVDKLFFAGTAYTDGGDWGSVHAAARAARRVVDELT